ncbi:MAG: cysteine desulfurase NifS [Verrucomicrobia bacterium GWF2_62_7]|nr:MAG: cysteine desulfurase NifS [Verrucomicrobia bacterium GWF2_62_7]
MRRIYLDHNATTPVHPEALKAMLPFLEANYGNPSSMHFLGRDARAALDNARERLAKLLGAKPGEIVFTGSGTEADNQAVFGAVRALAGRARHVITSPVEHHAVLHSCEHLRQHEGVEVTVLPVDGDGIVSPDDVRNAIRDGTVLVSVMWANNETGALQPVHEIGAICRERGVLFHTDAVQAFGKVRVNVSDLPVDLLSVSSHKVYGPKGVGALWIRPRTKIESLLHGGSHENDRRAGTENVAGIVGFVRAAEITVARTESEDVRLRALTERLWQGLSARIERIRRNGPADRRVANTLNVSFAGCKSDALLMSLDLEGICASSGSACAVGSLKPSPVLLAMGLGPDQANGAVRFSLGVATTEADVDAVVGVMPGIVSRLRSFAA